MGIKRAAIQELDSFMSEFNIPPTRLGRELFGDPSFYKRLKEGDARVTDVTLDTIFRVIVEHRGQLTLDLDFDD